MAESSNEKQIPVDRLIPSGRNISISFDSDNIQMAGGQYYNINGTRLRDIYRSNKIVTHLFDGVVLEVLGGARDDQDVKNISTEYLHLQVLCHTDERFIEVLDDYYSGKMKTSLQEEFSKIGLEVEGLTIEIENMEEVNEQKARILNRCELISDDDDDLCQGMRNVHMQSEYQEEVIKQDSALAWKQKALGIRLNLYGEIHPDTAQSYHEIGVTQSNLKDYNSALQSHQHALQIRVELYGENHPDTARSYRDIGLTQREMKDYNSASRSYKKALQIRVKLYGENHPETAESYQDIGLLQDAMKNYK